ncbi:MAG: hypothetical protein M0R80_22125 [Proteobacteria bacterium]|nr:hypothetical protein [Pseudomonadota bacterium]
MIARNAAVVAAFVALAAAGACQRGGEEGAAGPRAAAEDLLALHGLLGRQPESFTEEERSAPVDRGAVAQLVSDLGAYDEFTGDLYVGFVVGALATQQGRWTTSMDGDRAVVAAGQARIAFVRRGGAWKVELAASVPEPIRKRAAEEKLRYEAAKAAGKSLR